MRNVLMVFGFALVVLSSCNKPNDEDRVEIDGRWDLTNVSGGIAGIDCDVIKGDEVWSFVDGTLTVDSTVPDTAGCRGKHGGTYSYSILEMADMKFLVIDDQEFGEILISNNVLTLDQNGSSQGSGADGFVLRLEP